MHTVFTSDESGSSISTHLNRSKRYLYPYVASLLIFCWSALSFQFFIFRSSLDVRLISTIHFLWKMNAIWAKVDLAIRTVNVLPILPSFRTLCLSYLSIQLSSYILWTMKITKSRTAQWQFKGGDLNTMCRYQRKNLLPYSTTSTSNIWSNSSTPQKLKDQSN